MDDLNRLVPINDVIVGGALTPTCNARELHAYLEVRRDFSNWIKARITKYGFAVGVDFVTEVCSPNLASEKPDCSPNRGSNTRGGHNVIDYHLTLDMAKELAMVENNPMGRQVRRYFIECEKQVIAARSAAFTAPAPTDAAFAQWLTLSTDERRTRQRDVLIDTRLYGSAGGRYTSFQVGRPMPPSWVLTAAQQHELELARGAGGVTVMVNVPGGGTH